MPSSTPQADIELGAPTHKHQTDSDSGEFSETQPVLEPQSDQTQDSHGNAPSVFSKAYYQRFFDLTTEDLLKRLLFTVIFCNGQFYPDDASAGNRPDLYGPFWIVTTLVLVMGIVGNVQQSDGALDILKVTYAAITFYFALVFPPLLVTFILSKLNAKRSVVNITSLYGYSFLIYIPCSIAALLPIPYMGLVAASVAFVMSTLFLLKNIYMYMSRSPAGSPRLGLGLILGIAILHAGIAVITYFFFFKDYMPDKSDSGGA